MRLISSVRLIGIMLIGVLAMSSGSIFIRWALNDGAPPLVIAAYRLSIATVVLGVLVLSQRGSPDYAKLGRRDGSIVFLSGVLLAFHFGTWISSLASTSVLSSVVLVSTTPIWIGLGSPIFLKEPTPLIMWAGLAAAMVGVAIIGLADLGSSRVAAGWGDALAMSGAIFAAGYFMIGRRVRAQLPLIQYLWMVYGVAAIVLLIWVALQGLPMTGYAPRTLIWLVALGLIPQLIGHSAANYVIRHVSATLVGIGALGEPIGAAVLALILLHEWPQPVQVGGAVIILVGIGIASLGEKQTQPDSALLPSG